MDFSCSQITDDGIANFAEKFPALKDVFLGGCNNISDRSVASLAYHCHQLRTVDLSHTEVSDKGLASLGEGCRELRMIGLNGLENISDNGVEMLIDRCSSLEIVTLLDSVVNILSVCHDRPGLKIANNLDEFEDIFDFNDGLFLPRSQIIIRTRISILRFR